MTKDDYTRLLLLTVNHHELAVEKQELEARLSEIRTLTKDIEKEIHPIAPGGDSVVDFDDRTFLIQVDEDSVSVKVIPEILVTE
jgi:hypothetical protein